MDAYSAIEEIPFEAAIASPLLACNDAQARLMADTFEKFQSFFKKREKDGVYLPVYEHIYYLEEDGKTGQRLRIPRLGLLPVPTLEVEEVNIHFQARVTAISKDKLNVRMLNEQTESTSSQTTNCYLSVRLHAGVSDMPMGLAKFYQLCSDQMTSVTAEVG
jgi:hypothetical protein